MTDSTLATQDAIATLDKIRKVFSAIEQLDVNNVVHSSKVFGAATQLGALLDKLASVETEIAAGEARVAELTASAKYWQTVSSDEMIARHKASKEAMSRMSQAEYDAAAARGGAHDNL